MDLYKDLSVFDRCHIILPELERINPGLLFTEAARKDV